MRSIWLGPSCNYEKGIIASEILFYSLKSLTIAESIEQNDITDHFFSSL